MVFLLGKPVLLQSRVPNQPCFLPGWHWWLGSSLLPCCLFTNRSSFQTMYVNIVLLLQAFLVWLNQRARHWSCNWANSLPNMALSQADSRSTCKQSQSVLELWCSQHHQTTNSSTVTYQLQVTEGRTRPSGAGHVLHSARGTVQTTFLKMSSGVARLKGFTDAASVCATKHERKQKLCQSGEKVMFFKDLDRQGTVLGAVEAKFMF